MVIDLERCCYGYLHTESKMRTDLAVIILLARTLQLCRNACMGAASTEGAELKGGALV